MTYKWIRMLFLVSISFLVLGILISCKNPNSSGAEDKDSPLTLSSLSVCGEGVTISNLSDVKTEVESYFVTLKPSDVVAMFMYEKQTTPVKLDVTIDKADLRPGENIIKLSVEAVAGKYRAWEQKVTITRKELASIPLDTRLDAIEVAVVGEKKGKPDIEESKPLEGFERDNPGPYEAEDAKTAYIALKVRAAKPSGGDFTIKVVNKTTYLAPVTLLRSSEGDGSYFFQKRITLSKGRNILEVRVKSPYDNEEGVYVVMVQYEGGPDPTTLEMNERKMIPGIYCPAQRKPLKGELPDHVWMMGIAGW